MKIIIVGASGTMGRYLGNAFGNEHDIIRVSRHEGDILADIYSVESIESMFRQAGAFDALICVAGPTFVGPWAKMSPPEFSAGLTGKLLGQVNLVLIGQHYINPGGSFTLITGGLTDEPQRNFANASAANGAVEAFVRAAAVELPSGVRINAVSPTVLEDSPQYFPYFPGEAPTKMEALELGFRKSLWGVGTGRVIRV